MTELDIHFEWKRGFSFRYRKYNGKYIETMPASDEFVAWREGKTAQVNELLKIKERNDRLAKRNES